MGQSVMTSRGVMFFLFVSEWGQICRLVPIYNTENYLSSIFCVFPILVLDLAELDELD